MPIGRINEMLVTNARGLAYPSLLWDNGLRDDLEVVHVENILDWWASSPGSLPGLLLLCDLLDDLSDSAGIDDTEADDIVWAPTRFSGQ